MTIEEIPIQHIVNNYWTTTVRDSTFPVKCLQR